MQSSEQIRSVQANRPSIVKEKTLQSVSSISSSILQNYAKRQVNDYMKGVGVGKQNKMSDFWADLTKIAVKNEQLKIVDRSATETIVGTTMNPNANERRSTSRGEGIQSMHGTNEGRNYSRDSRSGNRHYNNVGTAMC